MSAVTATIKQQVFARANYRCEYCQTSHRLVVMPSTIEHVIPIALGGTDEPENLAAACYRCNEYKGSQSVMDCQGVASTVRLNRSTL